MYTSVPQVYAVVCISNLDLHSLLVVKRVVEVLLVLQYVLVMLLLRAAYPERPYHEQYEVHYR